MARSALMNIMVQAASKAGRGLTRDFNEVENLQVSKKGPADFVTQADIKAEKTIRQELEKARPGYSFLMEEAGEISRKSDYRWIIDPLDGTMNFLHSIPHFAVSIALEHDGALVAGVIYNPITEELFTAEKGRGAFFNDRRMRVAARKDLAECVVVTGIPALNKTGHPHTNRVQKDLMMQLAGLRASGSAALNLAWLAAGRYDGYTETGLEAWDVAAGMLMVREAGGYVSEPDPKASIYETGRIIAGNEFVHAKLREIVHTKA
ncbi:inositol monophosphatase family protein [Pseudahrensia aquimaris]|uniref:Inositol-1-monophosphatase n=1 Tax=Pseudahrensia aquimaris TaxID=744461 RepID=A0ABW3FA51_9HYPH